MVPNKPWFLRGVQHEQGLGCSSKRRCGPAKLAHGCLWLIYRIVQCFSWPTNIKGGTTLSLVNIEGWWGIIVIHVSDIDLPTSVVNSGACPDSIPQNMLGRVSSWGMAGMAMQDSSTTICYHVINGGLGAIFALMYHYFGHNHLTHQ